jgi:hypothetical protein
MMPGPDGASAVPLAPEQLGDGDVMGDGIEGAPTPEKVEDPAVVEAKMIEDQAEAGIRNDLLTQAYGTKIPQRRAVDRE